ncbi:MAG: UDP-N-acetylmuramate dehydrogenase [Chitinophagaceae bacterium]
MQVQQNYPLKKYNTFGVETYARYFSTFSSTEELENSLTLTHKLQTTNYKLFILGGGSNILFTKNYEGLILKNEIKGVNTIHEDEDHIYVKAGAGENWHQFVIHCIKNNFAGAENLSLIPGNIGASPMQNIGAYGVEVKDIFYSLEAFHLKEKRVVNFTLNDCEFGYRDSIFKNKYRDQFIILTVTYRLNKKPQYNISYGALKEELEIAGVKKLSIQAISQAVINIRSGKLPDPDTIGNAGSFFKNPEISNEKFQVLNFKFHNIVGYKLNNGNVKLAAAWLIEQCGWKGFRRGDAGCHEKQALVLVNYGNASGKEIHQLAKEIKQSVKEKFDVELQIEVNVT